MPKRFRKPAYVLPPKIEERPPNESEIPNQQPQTQHQSITPTCNHKEPINPTYEREELTKPTYKQREPIDSPHEQVYQERSIDVPNPEISEYVVDHTYGRPPSNQDEAHLTHQVNSRANYGHYQRPSYEEARRKVGDYDQQPDTYEDTDEDVREENVGYANEGQKLAKTYQPSHGARSYDVEKSIKYESSTASNETPNSYTPVYRPEEKTELNYTVQPEPPTFSSIGLEKDEVTEPEEPITLIIDTDKYYNPTEMNYASSYSKENESYGQSNYSSTYSKQSYSYNLNENNEKNQSENTEAYSSTNKRYEIQEENADKNTNSLIKPGENDEYDRINQTDTSTAKYYDQDPKETDESGSNTEAVETDDLTSKDNEREKLMYVTNDYNNKNDKPQPPFKNIIEFFRENRPKSLANKELYN